MSRKKKKGRSRKGSGSIYQVNEQLWCGQCTVGHRVETGKPIRKKVYGATREEAEEKLREEIRKYRMAEDGGIEAVEARKRRPLKLDIDHWLDGTIKAKVDKGSYDKVKQLIRDYIVPHLGDVPAVGLNQYLVKEWYKKLEEEGCSADMRNRTGQILRRFLDCLVRFGWIKSNPARELPLPKVVEKEIHPLDETEVQKFLDVVRTHRLYPLWLLALDTGMRQGEMLALEWRDIDLTTGVVSITKSVRTGEKGGARVKEVKSKSSRRRIRVGPHTLETLKEWRERCHGRLVFPNRGTRKYRGTERYINKDALFRTFKKLLAKAGLRPIRFHDLRHTHATLAILKTKNIKAVSQRLGHADIRVTLEVYAHYLPIMEEEIVSAMDALLSPQVVVVDQVTDTEPLAG